MLIWDAVNNDRTHEERQRVRLAANKVKGFHCEAGRPQDFLWDTKYEGRILEQAGIEQPKEEAVKPKAVATA
jgi:hypothetical protein